MNTLWSRAVLACLGDSGTGNPIWLALPGTLTPAAACRMWGKRPACHWATSALRSAALEAGRGEAVTVPPDAAALMQAVAWQTSETWRKKTRAWYLNPRAR